MSDYISRAEAIEEINKYHMTSGVTNQGTWNECVDIIAHTVAELPSADVRENIHGEWVIDGHHIRCNRCNEYVCNTDREGNKIPDNFCPNCGADMRTKEVKE